LTSTIGFFLVRQNKHHQQS